MTVNENAKDIAGQDKRITSLEKIVKGNGERGMDEIVRDVEKRMGVLEERMTANENAIGITNSEINHFRNVYFRREGLDAMGNPLPKSWVQETWEDKIAPNLLNNAVTAVIIVIIWNLRDLLDLVTSLSK